MRVEAPSLSLAELPNVVANVRRVTATDRFDVELADGTVIRASPLEVQAFPGGMAEL